MYATLVSNAGDGIEVDVPDDGRIEIYRDPDRGNEVVANVTAADSDPVGLSARDPSVSRRPRHVQLFQADDEVFVRDTGMSEPVVLEDVYESMTLTPGERYAVHQDATLHLGYDTEVGIDIGRERDDVPIGWRIEAARREFERGTNEEALHAAEALVDQLRLRGRDEDVYADAHAAFEDVRDQLQSRVRLGHDDADVPDSIRGDGVRCLDRLRAIYTQ
ncbi:hypothetical protein EXE46_15845 [Halorubrum sp. GN11_10-6_MGM]|uniref:hypothetical protein n=1 Tax=Halorubrum sp. GN11_10-6_MGM TaxID=2518112 RepID=UPI0010F5E392|nr:hypothetical protein [Halorubrum sp. GN11_10-6_MGM]TKX72475.1 hypothetical protein EXE46_15845 [Halorubrum sp. GN11_10-6_MGM]